MFLYKCPIYDHSWPFFRHMCEFLSQNWGSDGHFEVLNRSYLWLVEKLWHKTQIFPFLFFYAILYKNRYLHLFCFLRFCVFCHNLCTNWNSDLFSTSKWPSESQFCERWMCSWSNMARYGPKMAIYQLLFFGSSPNLHGALGYI